MRWMAKGTVWIGAGVLILFGGLTTGKAGTRIPAELLREAKTLAALEADYFKKRLANDWRGIYEYQHPGYRRHVSLEKFKNFEGRAVYVTGETSQQHMSGAQTPAPALKGFMGLPISRRYKMFTNPHIQVKDYRLETVSISEDGEYAMTRITTFGREQLNPALVKTFMGFDFKRPYIDFWEKVEGRWVITLLSHPVSVSGKVTQYLVPNNNSAWDTTRFVDIDRRALGDSSRIR